MSLTKHCGWIACFGLAILALPGCREDGIQHYRVARSESSRDELGYSAPKNWQQLGPDPKGFYQCGFQVTNGDQAIQITITPLEGAAGGLLQNTNRWRRQLQLDPVDEEQLQRDIQKIVVAGAAAKYLDFASPESAGQSRQRILGVVLPRNGKTWFFKMIGPAGLVENQKTTFEAFMRSVTFESQTGKTDG